MSTRGDGETVNVRRATVADVATISALNADVQAVHAAALPWLFKTPSAETFPPATAAACSQEMMSWFTSPTSVMSRVSYQVFDDAASAVPFSVRCARQQTIGISDKSPLMYGPSTSAPKPSSAGMVSRPTTNDYGCADQQTDQVRRPAS